MKKKSLLCLSMVSMLFSLTGCFKDPVQEFMDKAMSYYEKYLENYGPNASKNVYYYEGTSTRTVVFNPSADEEIKYLGLFNISNLSFSEDPSYFCDIGNVEISVTYDGSRVEYDLPNYSENGQFQLSSIIENPPLILIKEEADGTFTKFSQITADGELNQHANAATYDQNLFFIKDLKFDFGQISIDYSDNKVVAILRRDLYEVFLEMVEQQDLPDIIDAQKILLSSYKRINNLREDEEVSKTITIPGTYNGEEVVVGPMSFGDAFGRLQEDGTYRPFIYDVNTIIIEEGVKEISYFAFDGADNLKNLYLPSTLEIVDNNGLSNLNLNNLYIGNGTEPIDFVQLGNFEITNNAEILPALGNTTVRDGIIFEGYDNVNVSSFPFNSLSKPNGDQTFDYSSIVYFSEDREVIHDLSLKEAIDRFDTISGIHYLAEDDNKVISTGEVSEIPEGKTLLLESSKMDLGASSQRKYTQSGANFTPTYEDATLKLQLDSDLTIKGDIVLSSTIGKNNDASGVISGQYSSIDLNGHNLIIENGGSLVANGLITNSKTDGGIIVKNGGTLKANIGINDFYGMSNFQEKYNNNDSPFLSYNFADINCDFVIENGGSLYGMMSYISNSSTVNHETLFAGNSNEAFIQFVSTDSKLSRIASSQNTVETIEVDGEVNVNPFTYSETQDSSSLAFPLVSYSLMMNFKGTANINTPIKIMGDSTVGFNNLNVNQDIYIYKGQKLEDYNNYPDLTGVNDGKFSVSGTITIKDATILGTINVAESNYEALKANLSSFNSYEKIVEEGALNPVSSEYNVYFKQELTINIKSDTKELIKDDSSTFMEYSNNGNDGTLYDNSANVLASYTNNGDWVASINGQTFQTGVSSNSLITSFYTDIDDGFYLNQGVWYQGVIGENLAHYYVIDGAQYISLNGKLTQGTYNSNGSFNISGVLYLYIEENSAWERMTAYENGNVLANDALTHIYYLNEYYNFVRASSYDQVNHYLISEDGQNAIAFTSEGIVIAPSSTDFTYKSFTNSTTNRSYIYYGNEWLRVNEMNYETAIAVVYKQDDSHDTYVFTKDNRWLPIKYTSTATSLDHYFVTLDTDQYYDGVNYRFGLYVNSDNNKYQRVVNYVVPEGKLNINKVDFEDIWPSNLTEDQYVGYRHYVNSDDGKNYLFFENESGVVEERKFTFASGFTPSQPIHTDDTSPAAYLTRFDFIRYQVIFEGDTEATTIYLDIGADLIICGDTSLSSDDLDYLAFGVFSLDNPIQNINS